MPVIATYRHRIVVTRYIQSDKHYAGAYHLYVGRTCIHYWRYPYTPLKKILSWIAADLRDHRRRYIAPNADAPPEVHVATYGDYPAGSPYDFAE